MKAPAEMARLFRGHEHAMARSVEIVERCRFSLDELRYEYPEETSGGRDPMVELEAQVAAGAQRRYPAGVPPAVVTQLRHELDLIRRSEEHTSELQSLMRSAYGVFCLKKKNTER